jgi:hypothetical protein
MKPTRRTRFFDWFFEMNGPTLGPSVGWLVLAVLCFSLMFATLGWPWS